MKESDPGKAPPDNRKAAGDPAAWIGLSGLSRSQREALAAAIAPPVVAHLRDCLRKTLAEWSQGSALRHKADAMNWGARLASSQAAIVHEFQQALSADLTTTDYPPVYSFSGISFAGSRMELRVLADYELSRRALRHDLEAVVRSVHAYSFFIFSRAALQEHRFQHPNWAPWSPLNWFERLFEAAERHFGQEALTLELMRAYVHCLHEPAGPLLARVVEGVEDCDLIDHTDHAYEYTQEFDHRPDWRRRAAVAQATGIPQPDAAAMPAPEPPPRAPVPRDTGSAAQWAHWIASLVDSIRSGATHVPGASAGGRTPAPTDRPGVSGSGPPTHRAVESPGIGLAPDPGQPLAPLPTEPRLSRPDVPGEALSDTALAANVKALLRALFETIFRLEEFHPRVQALIMDLEPDLALLAARDLDFLLDPEHPLRVWVGGILNAGIQISPQGIEPDQGPARGYLHCIGESVAKLHRETPTLDRAGAQAVLKNWRDRLAAETVAWRKAHRTHIAPLLATECRARAWRNLGACALAADASLPPEAANAITDVWTQIMLIAEDTGHGPALNDDIKAVACTIFRRSRPADVVPVVNRLTEHARVAGLPDDSIRNMVATLGTAHLAYLKAPSSPHFDSATWVARKPVRARDDDPDLLVDLVDSHVYSANRVRVGDWFSFVHRGTGEVERLALIWRGEASRHFLFLALDGNTNRIHSLQGLAGEMREGRVRYLPADNPLDAFLR